jgi:hypothetical protein
MAVRAALAMTIGLLPLALMRMPFRYASVSIAPLAAARQIRDFG